MNFSKQRELILNEVLGRTDHPTAEMIHEGVSKIKKNISLGTVYRNLNLLVDLGEIKRIPVVDGSDRFDKTVHEHHHMICSKCGKVYDIFYDLKEVTCVISNETSHDIENHEILFNGVCSKCKQK